MSHISGQDLLITGLFFSEFDTREPQNLGLVIQPILGLLYGARGGVVFTTDQSHVFLWRWR